MVELRDQVRAVRHFNRFYTREIAALEPSHLGSGCSLTEARLLFEIGRLRAATASRLCAELDLDPGQASRVVSRLARRRLVARRRSSDDARERVLSLTAAGRRVLARLNRRTNAHVRSLLSPLPAERQGRVLEAMAAIERTLGRGPADVSLRSHGPGDIGWVVKRHGELYAAAYGFDARFEAEVAAGLARFGARHDPERERLWIAECGGERIGCATVVRAGPRLAQFRWFLIEPELRGLGLGRRLLDQSLEFGARAGYRRMTLLTQDVLERARRVYVAAGFKRVASEPNERWGVRVQEERWERLLELC